MKMSEGNMGLKVTGNEFVGLVPVEGDVVNGMVGHPNGGPGRDD